MLHVHTEVFLKKPQFWRFNVGLDDHLFRLVKVKRYRAHGFANMETAEAQMNGLSEEGEQHIYLIKFNCSLSVGSGLPA